MEMPLSFIFDLGWIFFGAWGTVLATVSIIAFRRICLRPTNPRGATGKSIDFRIQYSPHSPKRLPTNFAPPPAKISSTQPA